MTISSDCPRILCELRSWFNRSAEMSLALIFGVRRRSNSATGLWTTRMPSGNLFRVTSRGIDCAVLQGLVGSLRAYSQFVSHPIQIRLPSFFGIFAYD